MPLLLAGRLPQVALVLVRLSIGPTYGVAFISFVVVVFVALKKQNKKAVTTSKNHFQKPRVGDSETLVDRTCQAFMFLFN